MDNAARYGSYWLWFTNFFNSSEYITVNGPSDLMEFRKHALRRGHCE